MNNKQDKEQEMNICCNEEMTFIGDVACYVSSDIEKQNLYVCLNCCNYKSVTIGEYDIEEFVNILNNFATLEQKKNFLKFHSEFQLDNDGNLEAGIRG